MGLCEQAAEPASTSVRAIFLNCNSKLTGDEYRNSTIEIFPQLIETAFKSKNVKVVLAIAEGCTRISLNLDNRTMQGLGGVCTPVFGKITDCMNFLENPHNKQNLSTNQSGQLILIMQTLALSLQTLSIIVQYLDSAQSSKQPISELLNAMWPLLQKVANSPYCRQHDDVLNQLLKVHGRCVNSFGDVIEPKIGELINVVVQAYEETHHSCCCEFVGIAVEKFSAKGGGVEESFCQVIERSEAKRASLVTYVCEATTNPLLIHSCSRASLKIRLASLGAAAVALVREHVGLLEEGGGGGNRR